MTVQTLIDIMQAMVNNGAILPSTKVMIRSIDYDPYHEASADTVSIEEDEDGTIYMAISEGPIG
jgi:hypothetical protein